MGQEPVPTESLRMTFEAIPRSIAVARTAVTDYARACRADVERVAIATSEAVTNVVRHAYRDGPPGPVQLSAGLERSDLVVTVADKGLGMAPHPELPSLGMGIALMGSMASDVAFESTSAGLAVTMWFPCAKDKD